MHQAQGQGLQEAEHHATFSSAPIPPMNPEQTPVHPLKATPAGEVEESTALDSTLSRPAQSVGRTSPRSRSTPLRGKAAGRVRQTRANGRSTTPLTEQEDGLEREVVADTSTEAIAGHRAGGSASWSSATMETRGVDQGLPTGLVQVPPSPDQADSRSHRSQHSLGQGSVGGSPVLAQGAGQAPAGQGQGQEGDLGLGEEGQPSGNGAQRGRGRQGHRLRRAQPALSSPSTTTPTTGRRTRVKVEGQEVDMMGMGMPEMLGDIQSQHHRQQQHMVAAMGMDGVGQAGMEGLDPMGTMGMTASSDLALQQEEFGMFWRGGMEPTSHPRSRSADMALDMAALAKGSYLGQSMVDTVDLITSGLPGPAPFPEMNKMTGPMDTLHPSAPPPTHPSQHPPHLQSHPHHPHPRTHTHHPPHPSMSHSAAGMPMPSPGGLPPHLQHLHPRQAAPAHPSHLQPHQRIVRHHRGPVPYTRMEHPSPGPHPRPSSLPRSSSQPTESTMGGITTASSTPSPMSMSTPGLMGNGVFAAQQEQRMQHPGQESMVRRGSSQYSLDLRRQQEQQLMRLVAQRQQREKREGSVSSGSKSSPGDGQLGPGPNGRHHGNGRDSGQRTPMDLGEMGGGQRTPMDMTSLGDGQVEREEFERGVTMEHQRREHARQMQALAGYHRPQHPQQQHPSQHPSQHQSQHHHPQHHPQHHPHQHVTSRPDYPRPASSMGAMQSDGYNGGPRQGSLEYHPHPQQRPSHHPQHHPQHPQHSSYPSFDHQQQQQHRSHHQPPPDSYGLGDWNLVSMGDGGMPAFIDDGVLAGGGAGNVGNGWSMEDLMRPGGMGMGIDGVDDFKMLG